MTDPLEVTPQGQTTRRVCSICGRCRSLLDFMPSKPRKPIRTISHVCRDCRTAASKSYREQHRERLLEQQREWNACNAERLKSYRAARYQANREEICARERERYARVAAADPEKYRAKFHQRRAQIQSNGGTYTSEEWHILCSRYGNICLRCYAKTKLTVDHIVPVSRGGSNSIENLQPLCRFCNATKSDKIINYRKHHDYLNGYDQEEKAL